MNLKEIQNLPVRVRVLKTDRNIEEMQAMVGGDFEVRITYHYDKTRNVWNADKSDSWTFKEEELQVLTPIKFEGKTIGIGDKVNGDDEVFGFTCSDGVWSIRIAMNGNYNRTTYYVEREIKSHTPLHSSTTEMTVAQIEEKLGITGLKIIK